MAKLDREFTCYREHQDELVLQFEGKFVVIHDDHVLGAFDTESEAIAAMSPTHPLGTFLIQKCEPGNAAYTQWV